MSVSRCFGKIPEVERKGAKIPECSLKVPEKSRSILGGPSLCYAARGAGWMQWQPVETIYAAGSPTLVHDHVSIEKAPAATGAF